MDKQPIWYTEEQENEIQAFIQLNFGESNFVSHELESEYVHTDTALIAPDGQSRTFVTFGMGARPMHSPTQVKRIELAISASPAVDVHSKDAFLLAGEVTHISKYPFREDTWLGEGHTINASEDFKERFGYAYFAFWDLGLSFRPAPTEGNQNPFRDKTVAVSGTFERMDRDTVIALLESLGAMVDSAVTSGTDFLLFGNLPSSKKVSAAIAKSVAMINERQFAEMLEQNR